MCDPLSLWHFSPSALFCRPRCHRFLACSGPEAPRVGKAPAQEDLQAEPHAQEALLGGSPRQRPTREGLRSRPHAFRTQDDHVSSELPETRSWRTPAEIDALLRVDAAPLPESPCRKVALADAPLLAVEEAIGEPTHHEPKVHAQAKRRRAWRRRSAPLRRPGRRSRAKAPEEEAEHPEHQPTEAAFVAEAYGYGFYRPCWDWPLSRLEKKLRLLELDRELMKADREEMESLLKEAWELRLESKTFE